MKKYILTIIVGLLSLSAIKAQGNLQFNQVINNQYTITNSSSNYENITYGTITVPPGKVYKIESVSSTHYTYSNSTIYPNYFNARIGEHLIWVRPDHPIVLLPLWLSEGTYQITGRNTASGYLVNLLFSFSAIEFNIVP